MVAFYRNAADAGSNSFDNDQPCGRPSFMQSKIAVPETSDKDLLEV